MGAKLNLDKLDLQIIQIMRTGDIFLGSRTFIGLPYNEEMASFT